MLFIPRFSFRIEGKEELLKWLPDQWEEYLTKPDNPGETFVLRLEEDESFSVFRISPGWGINRSNNIKQAMYAPDGRVCFSLSYDSLSQEVTVRVSEASKSYIRIGVLYGMLTALHRVCVGLHGVTLLCGGEIVILSAPSGTGKTTLSHLLETYRDAIVINGDFALLYPTAEGVIFEPTPFCGTSGRCLKHRVRVNRVVFLAQAKTNEWRELTGREALTLFMDNAFIPTWDDGIRRAVQENIVKCLSALQANAFSFAPTQEAAEVFFKQRNCEDFSS